MGTLEGTTRAQMDLCVLLSGCVCTHVWVYIEVKDRCWVSSSVTFYLSLETGSLIEAGAH